MKVFTLKRRSIFIQYEKAMRYGHKISNTVLVVMIRNTVCGLREMVIFLYPGETTFGVPGSFWGATD